MLKGFIIIILFIIAGCNQKPPATLTHGKWHIVKVEDDKPTTGLLSFDYVYNPAADSTKSYIEFLDGNEYVVANLYDAGYDTNTYQVRGDTMYTNKDPRDYLVILQGTNDTFRLYNREQMVTLTLVKMKD